MPFVGLYDANVLIPYEVRDILMVSASTRQHAVYWSEDIFEEWLRNSTGKKLASEESVLRFQGIMNRMFPEAFIARERYERLISSMTNEAKDRHVLAAAVVAEVDVVVTFNVKDFPRDSIAPYDIEVQTPDQFVRHQAGLAPLVFKSAFLARADTRDRLSRSQGKGPLTPADIAMFLRDGPSRMPESGKFILELLGSSI
ncbi:PIN domain-containing protein [bacterium]|jgi:hypothetical protein|nr:PIN domain-containing protein [bacterium]